VFCTVRTKGKSQDNQDKEVSINQKGQKGNHAEAWICVYFVSCVFSGLSDGLMAKS
jgi:hypothetical protein